MFSLKPETWIKLKDWFITILVVVLLAWLGAMLFYTFYAYPELASIKISLNNYFYKCFSNCVIQFKDATNFIDKCKMVCEVG